MVEQVPLVPYNVFMTEPSHLPIREAGDDGGPDFVVEAVVKERHAQGIVLQGKTCSGTQMSIEVRMVGDGIARVLLEERDADSSLLEDRDTGGGLLEDGDAGDGGRVRLARELPPIEDKVRVEQVEGVVCLETASLTIKIDLQPFHIAFYGADGTPLLSQNYSEVTNIRMKLTVLPFGMSKVNGTRVAFHDTFTAEPDEHFFGLGEKFTDFDKRGQRITTWNYDCGGAFSERSYKNVPFVMSTRKYGIFVDSTCAVDFDMVASNTATFSLISPDSALDYYIIAGPDLKTVITRYASLVSFPILPPKWSLGTWISSGFQRDSAAEVMKRARMIREYDIPCDVLHLDCYWQRFGCWSDLIWDKEMFPDPARLIADIKALGFKVCLWINSYIGIKSERFIEGSEKGYFLKNAEGETYVVDMWGGFHPPVGVIDVTHPGAIEWFKEMLRESLRIGVDVFKTDFGEGIPRDVAAYSGIKGEYLHNLYALLYNDVVAEVTAEVTGHTGLVWARSTYAGGQRHAAQWGGDANCTFSAMAATLRSGLSIGMCGHAFWSHDIGGFTGHPTPELYARWAQFGLFSPLTRAHGNSTRLPWEFGEEALDIFRSYARLRYRLLPYIYTYASIAAQTSLPMMRPMVLEFPEDPSTYTMDLQYMFGAEFLVAPIYNVSGTRSVYLPEGTWIDFWTHGILTGPRTVYVRPPLAKLPLYVKANALIPTVEPTVFTADEPFEHITVDAYVLEQGTFDIYDTDGVTRVAAKIAGNQLRIFVDDAKHRLSLRLIALAGQPAIADVYINGSRCVEDTQQDEQNAQNSWKRTEDGVILVQLNMLAE